MDSTLVWQLVLQVVLIALNAIFACAEIAVISVKDVRIEQLSAEGNKAAIKLGKLTEQPERFLSTIQIAITLSGYLGSAAAATNFAGLITNAVISLGVGISPSIINSVAVVLVTLILSYFTLVFGELVPKRLAMKNPEGISLKLAGMLYAISKAFKPIVSLLSVSVNGVLRLLDEKSDMLNQTAGALKVSNIHDLPARAAALTAELRSVQKELDDLKQRQTAMKASGLFEDAKDVDGIKIFTMYLTGTATDALRKLCDNARDKAPASVTAVIGEAEGKTTLAVAVGKEAQARGLAAGKLVKEIAAVAGGNGGGKPDFAMAGIKDTSRIDDALNAVPGIVKAALV